ncbi:MAG: hypothetical protein AAF682_03390 [Planctomycetota bacterium]
MLTELAFRALLFRDVPGLSRVAARLRQPGNFYERTDPGYWLASAHFRALRREPPDEGLHPTLGWISRVVDRETFAHDAESLLLDRRPVLLFGDSFAQCTTAQKDCWEGQLQRSELRRSHLLLNYGVGGYGLGQIYLLLRNALPRFAGRDPIVVVGIYVDDDLDRAVLPLRGRPKPRFEVRDGRLVEPDPLPAGIGPYLSENPLKAPSWVWRYLLHGTGLLPARWRDDGGAHRREVEELTRALLEALRADLTDSGHEWFVLLLHGQVASSERRDRVWQHAFLTETLKELGIPYVSSRDALDRHRDATGTDPALYFGERGRQRGHYTPLGNEAVFEALLEGLKGDVR